MTPGTARSLLFVPGDRPDRFARATASGADVVVVDLEDAVAPDAKDGARDQVVAAVTGGLRAAVRVNAVGTPWHEADLRAAAALGVPVVLPKADAAACARVVPRVHSVVALVETARGVLESADVAGLEGVVRLALGHLDLAADLGVSPDCREVVDRARTDLLLASVAAGLPGPVDGVTPQVRDTVRLGDDVARATRLGATGKLCVHPDQVAVVHAAMAPTPAQQDWARRVLDAHAASPEAGVVLVDDQMVDAPVLHRARHLLARSRPTEGERP